MITKKRVNIFPRGPINTNPPIRTPLKAVLRSIQDIRKAIICGARVEEILSDKSIVVLNIQNYDLDNEGKGTSKGAPHGLDFRAAQRRPAISLDHDVEPVRVVEPAKDAEETVVMRMSDSIAPVEHVEVAAEPAVSKVDMSSSDEEQHLSRKQRRALERKRKEEAESNSEVETQDVE